jgi:hypothetical protein
MVVPTSGITTFQRHDICGTNQDLGGKRTYGEMHAAIHLLSYLFAVDCGKKPAGLGELAQSGNPAVAPTHPIKPELVAC